MAKKGREEMRNKLIYILFILFIFLGHSRNCIGWGWNWGEGGKTTAEYLQASLANDQTNFDTGDDVEFDTIDTSAGSSISLNTSTGIFTLEAGKTYKLTSGIRFEVGGAAKIGFAWYNITTTSAISQLASLRTQSSTADYSSLPIAKTIITPTVTTEISVRCTWEGDGTEDVNAGYVWAIIEVIVGDIFSDIWKKAGSDIYYNIGNIGIGTNIPSTILHLGDATGITIGDGSDADQDLFTVDVTDTPRVFWDESDNEIESTCDWAFPSASIKIGTVVLSDNGGQLNVGGETVISSLFEKSTGLIRGGVISINVGDNTLIDISIIEGQIVDTTTDPNNPILIPILVAAKIGYNLTTMPDPGDVVAIFLALDSGGNVVERLMSPTSEERRNTIDLGIVARIETGLIVFAGSGPTNIVHNPSAQLQDLLEAWGTFNVEGNRIQPNAADLQIKKTEGSVFCNGANFHINKKNPHIRLLIEQAPVSPFNYKLSNGTDVTLTATVIDPDNYDDGTSILATVPNNKWTIQYITVFAGGVVEILYGQEIFSSEADAILAIPSIDFIIPTDSKKAIPLAYLVVQQGDTLLPANRFYRITRGGAGGGSLNYWNRTGTELSPANVGDSAILATQTELATYPNFSADPSWTIFSGANTWTYDGTTDRMRPTGEAAGDTIADTGIALTSGKTYAVSLSWFKDTDTGYLQVYQGSAGTQKSDYIDDGTYSRKWIFTATAGENLFMRGTGNFHDDTTTNYISQLSVIEIDNAGDIISNRLALGGLAPEYYNQIESYADTALFFPSDKDILTINNFEVRNVNSGGLDFDETYGRIILGAYDISLSFGSSGYTTTSLRGDNDINLRTYTAGGIIELNKNLIDTDYVLNGAGVEAHRYDAGNATHVFNGNVGIGINSPNSILHIKANTPGTIGSHPAGQLIIQDPDDSIYGNAVITGYESDGAGNPDQQLWYLGSSSGSNGDIIFLNRRNANLHLGTNSVSRLSILYNGNVGIGTNNPKRQFDFDGANMRTQRYLDTDTNLNLGYETFGAGNLAHTVGNEGWYNVALGHRSLYNNTIGNSNIGLGSYTLDENTTGFSNMAIGASALGNNTIGFYNTAVGRLALFDNTTGSYNTAIGSFALRYVNPTVAGEGEKNIGIGYEAGNNITTGSHNIIIGYDIGAPIPTGDDQLNIGNTIYGDLSSGNIGIGETNPTSKLQVVGLPVYANNAAAITGGLTMGAFYRTGADPDPVCVVH